jgi:D-alanyl-D-alanine carboxypeptidase (penicillin-binding protein 5/6)
MKKKLLKRTPLLLILVFIAYVAFALFRSLPNVQPTLLPLNIQTASSLVWPSQGESAVGIVGSNVLDTNGVQSPKPTASTAKLITALMVLRAKPLSLNEQGPTLTMTQNDVDIYNQYVTEDGSVVKVQAGEELSEYQMLQAMLLPSANNIADSLADWSYGSLASYSAAANSYVKSLGLSGTTIGSDASGYDPSTVSTAEDLVKLGELVMQSPVLASIVDQASAELPIVGGIANVNNLLGTDNIVGIKTGNTDQAGGVFVGAVKFNLSSQSKVIVSANVGADSLSDALSSSSNLLKSVQTNFHDTTLLSTGTVVANYTAPWTKTPVRADTRGTITANVWGGNSFKVNLTGLRSVSYKAKAGDNAGSVSDGSLNSSTANVSLSAKIPSPSIWWRLSHP